MWALSAEDLERLDRLEGHPLGYRPGRLSVDTGEGRWRRVHV